MDRKIIHIFHNEKFTRPFYDLVKNNFESKRHYFIFLPGVAEDEFEIPIANNVLKVTADSKVFSNKFKLFQLLNRHCKHADKIILHSLLKQDLIRFLFFYRALLNKCYWVMWGGDVYQRPLTKPTLINYSKRYINRFIGKVVKSRVGHCVTYLEGDVEIAKRLYNTNAQYHECIMYPSNIYKRIELPTKQNDTLTILVGNSADESNNHEEVLEKLRNLKEQRFNIICPLSYGNKDHAIKIEKLGAQYFGKRFLALTVFMDFNDYLKLLADVDIAIFNHKRQQGMGNTITLLGLGKKVYMRKDTSQFQLFSDLNIKVFDAETIDNTPLASEVKNKNKSLICDFFCIPNLLFQWEKIFKE